MPNITNVVPDSLTYTGGTVSFDGNSGWLTVPALTQEDLERMYRHVARDIELNQSGRHLRSLSDIEMCLDEYEEEPKEEDVGLKEIASKYVEDLNY